MLNGLKPTLHSFSYCFFIILLTLNQQVWHHYAYRNNDSRWVEAFNKAVSNGAGNGYHPTD
ncbi:hypothetical protein BI198_03665 [Rheinheimera salexigens]|uniref:Uncharacterized protein n=1 Tax=Rheinheimera salexigens TaxID=1628148 RepID=A0A1E7Q3W0_9GAMM|nr:hypothetical protein BI198_03665 [Rheinheimera salexigens]